MVKYERARVAAGVLSRRVLRSVPTCSLRPEVRAAIRREAGESEDRRGATERDQQIRLAALDEFVSVDCRVDVSFQLRIRNRERRLDDHPKRLLTSTLS